MEVDGPGNNAEFDVPVSADWNGTIAVQACNTNPPIGSNCDSWSTFRAELPKATPALSTPNAEFCNSYASEAVARAEQGKKCGFTGARWDSNKQTHVAWCMQQKAQQQVWSEDSERKGQLADCAKKEVAAAPPKGNYSLGPPEVAVNADVDIYDKPRGEGQKLGILRKDSKVSLFERRPDQWCGVSGRAVATPTGAGFVWCGKGFELK
jgi:hypothetical protein